MSVMLCLHAHTANLSDLATKNRPSRDPSNVTAPGSGIGHIGLDLVTVLALLRIRDRCQLTN